MTWLQYASRRDVVLRAAKTAVLVGSVLLLINYGDRWYGAALTGADLVKMLLTICVPYCVSTYSSVAALRGAVQQGAESAGENASVRSD